MTASSKIPDRLNPDVIQFLLVSEWNWQKLPDQSSASLVVLQSPRNSQPTVRIIVPYWDGFQDYQVRMAITLEEVARRENVTVKELKSRMDEPDLLVGCYYDLIKEFQKLEPDEEECVTLAFRIWHLGRLTEFRLLTIEKGDLWGDFLTATQQHLDDLKTAGFEKAVTKTRGRLTALGRAA